MFARKRKIVSTVYYTVEQEADYTADEILDAAKQQVIKSIANEIARNIEYTMDEKEQYIRGTLDIDKMFRIE